MLLLYRNEYELFIFQMTVTTADGKSYNFNANLWLTEQDTYYPITVSPAGATPAQGQGKNLYISDNTALFRRCIFVEKRRDIDNVIPTSCQRRFKNVVSTSINRRGFTDVESTSIKQRCFHVESTLIRWR